MTVQYQKPTAPKEEGHGLNHKFLTKRGGTSIKSANNNMTDSSNVRQTGSMMSIVAPEHEKQEGLNQILREKIRQRIEGHYEAYLMSSNTVGSIFALKNMGWADRTEQTINQTIREVKVSVNQSDTNDLITNI